jgi:NAD(P)-dependent dehydrogenase (short-subunit alcohol dehydrogenase family)
VITGSSRGIGLTSARLMAAPGAKVVICGRKAQACESAAAEINEEPKRAGGEAIAVQIPTRVTP